MINDPTLLINNPQGQPNKYGQQQPANNPPSEDRTIVQDPGTPFQPIKKDDPRKIVGFLVSYSRLQTGEPFTLFLGKNSIGSNKSGNDIVLREGTVSGRHATLNVKRLTNRQTNQDELAFKITDENASNSVLVNGEDLFTTGMRILKNGDIIDIGNYQFILICIDTKALDLNPNPHFILLDQEESGNYEDYDKRDPSLTRIYQ